MVKFCLQFHAPGVVHAGGMPAWVDGNSHILTGGVKVERQMSVKQSAHSPQQRSNRVKVKTRWRRRSSLSVCWSFHESEWMKCSMSLCFLCPALTCTCFVLMIWQTPLLVLYCLFPSVFGVVLSYRPLKHWLTQHIKLFLPRNPGKWFFILAPCYQTH